MERIRQEREKRDREFEEAERELEEKMRKLLGHEFKPGNETIALNRMVNIQPMTDPFFFVRTESELAQLTRDRWVDIKARIKGKSKDLGMGAFLSLAGLNTVTEFMQKLENIVLNFDEVALAAGRTGAALGGLASVGTTALGSLLTLASDLPRPDGQEAPPLLEALSQRVQLGIEAHHDATLLVRLQLVPEVGRE